MKWKQVISKSPDDLQYRDADHRVSERSGANAFPTASPSTMVSPPPEMPGERSYVEGKLKNRIKPAREACPAAAIQESSGN